MAVRRIGDDSTARRVVQALGRVLVTIDDLRALHTLMTDLECVPGYDSPPEMGFKGGEFDKPEDLVELSDVELQSIWLRSPNVEIELSTRTATAIGRKDIAEAIYQRWARQRQTRDLPEYARKRQRVMHIALPPLFVVAVVLGVVVVDNQPMSAEWIAPMVFVFIMGIGMAVMLAKLATFVLVESYAIVRSVTLNDYRAARTESQKHWRTIAMSALAASIALAGLVIGLLFKK
jgi:uncharacterized membrane protein